MSIRNLKPKDLVTGLVFLQLTLDNLNGNLLLSFIVLKMKGSFAVFVVFTGNTDFASGVGNLYGFIVAGNLAVGTFSPVDGDNTLFLRGDMLDVIPFTFAKRQESWLIII